MHFILAVFTGLICMGLTVVLLINRINSQYVKLVKIYYALFLLLFTGLTSYVIFVHKDIAFAKFNNISLSEQQKKEKETLKSLPFKEKVILQAPADLQYPELPRGCEVTSLSMMLQYEGVKIDKLTLAKKNK